MTNCRSFARRCQRNYLPTVGDLQHFCVFCQWKHPLAQSSRRRWIWSMTSLQQRKVTEVPVAKATIGPRLALWTLRRGWPCQAQCLNFYKLWDYKIIIWFVFVHIVYTLYTIIISYFYRYGFVMCAFLNEIRTGIKTCLLVLVLKLMVQLERVDKTTKWLTSANVAGGLCVHCLEMHTTVFYWLDGSDNPCKGSVILSFGQPASDLCSTAGRWDLFASNASGAVSQLACELEGVNKKVLAQTWLVWHEGF